MVIAIVLGSFILVRPLLELFVTGPHYALRRHVDGAVLAIAGAATFWFAVRADRKNGIEVFSKRAWTSDLMVSAHVCFNMPMRLFGIALFLVSLLF